MRSLIQRLYDALYRPDHDQFSGLQVQGFHRCGLGTPARVRAQKQPTDSPERPYPDALCHLEDVAVASAEIGEASCESLPSRQRVGRLPQFAGLTKVSLWAGRSFQAGSKLLTASEVNVSLDGGIFNFA